jgi:hypothetical protein
MATEASGNLGVEMLSTTEVPSNTIIVSLPDIIVRGERIRLGMHTDSILTLLKTLDTLPDTDQLKVEGRVLNSNQKESLLEDPIYKFYLSGRMTRVLGSKDDVFVLPRDINLDSKEISSLLHTPFTPSILSQKIGYKVGYFSAREMINFWLSTCIINNFLPVIGGINEFKIGSETLSQDRLSQIRQQIVNAFIQQENSVSRSPINRAQLNGFQTFNIPSLLNNQLDTGRTDQIKNISDLIVGEKYKEMHQGKETGTTIKVLDNPYQKKGGWWVKVEQIFKDGYIYKTEISLADRGIVPYSPNNWNPTNFLIKDKS